MQPDRRLRRDRGGWSFGTAGSHMFEAKLTAKEVLAELEIEGRRRRGCRCAAAKSWTGASWRWLPDFTKVRSLTTCDDDRRRQRQGRLPRHRQRQERVARLRRRRAQGVSPRGGVAIRPPRPSSGGPAQAERPAVPCRQALGLRLGGLAGVGGQLGERLDLDVDGPSLHL